MKRILDLVLNFNIYCVTPLLQLIFLCRSGVIYLK